MASLAMLGFACALAFVIISLARLHDAKGKWMSCAANLRTLCVDGVCPTEKRVEQIKSEVQEIKAEVAAHNEAYEKCVLPVITNHVSSRAQLEKKIYELKRQAGGQGIELPRDFLLGLEKEIQHEVSLTAESEHIDRRLAITEYLCKEMFTAGVTKILELSILFGDECPDSANDVAGLVTTSRVHIADEMRRMDTKLSFEASEVAFWDFMRRCATGQLCVVVTDVAIRSPLPEALLAGTPCSEELSTSEGDRLGSNNPLDDARSVGGTNWISGTESDAKLFATFVKDKPNELITGQETLKVRMICEVFSL